LSRDNVFLVNEEEKFETAMGKLFFVRGEMTLSFLNSYVKIYPQKVSDLAKKLSMLRSIYSNAYTEIQKQSFYWTSYTLDNLHRVYKNEEMEAIEGAFKNKPAIIVSAGPSLNDNLEYLKKYRDKIVIFCVGTALKTLLKNGIKPDFVNIIESGFCSAQVSFVDLDGINFILYPSTYPDVYNHITQRVFNYYPDNLITSDWLKNLVGVDYTKYKNRGTVAITSMMSAFLCGCNPIILTGQDLAYKDGKCYASGSPYNLSYKEVSPGRFELFIDDFEKYAETRRNKANYDPEKFEKEVKKTLEDNSKKLCFVKGQDGRNLVTSPAYAMFVEHFENLALELQDKVKLYNTSTGGAQINGFENISMQEVLKQYANEPLMPRE
jgi:hypothetical protein